jgi:hypothetical protein
MNPRGYTGAAEAYIGLGQPKNAVAILRQGLEVVAPEDTVTLTEMLERLGEPILEDNLPELGLGETPVLESELGRSPDTYTVVGTIVLGVEQIGTSNHLFYGVRFNEPIVLPSLEIVSSAGISFESISYRDEFFGEEFFINSDDGETQPNPNINGQSFEMTGRLNYFEMPQSEHHPDYWYNLWGSYNFQVISVSR